MENKKQIGPEIPNFLNEIQQNKIRTREEKQREEIMKEVLSKPIKIVKINDTIPKKYLIVNIALSKLKKAIVIVLVAAMLAGIGYKDYNEQLQQNTFIESVIDSDYYLKSLVTYTSDSTPKTEIWKVNKVTKLQEPVTHEEVAEYIDNMDNLTEEEQKKVMQYFGVDSVEKHNARK